LSLPHHGGDTTNIQVVEWKFLIASNAYKMAIRGAAPLGLLAAGACAYYVLASPVAEVSLPPAPPQVVRTRVTELRVQDYPVVVKTHGVVQPHDQVILSAQVPGVVQKINPVFESGSYFAVGDVLLELDPRDYEIAVAVAEARELGAKAALQLANLEHARSQELSERKVITQAEFEQSSANRSQLLAEADAAVAQLERARRDLERTKVRAPFEGRVRRLTVGLGQTVGVGAPLGEVFAVDFAEVRLPIAGRELPFLDLPELDGDKSLEVELRDAVNEAASPVWRGRIIRTEGALDPDSLELFVIARVDDPFGRKSRQPPLRIGQPVKAAIHGKLLEDVVAVPRGAVRQLSQVFLVDREAMSLQARTIAPLWSDETHVLVRDPALAHGALLSTTHLVYAPQGAKVEILPDVEATLTHDVPAQGDSDSSVAAGASGNKQM